MCVYRYRMVVWDPKEDESYVSRGITFAANYTQAMEHILASYGNEEIESISIAKAANGMCYSEFDMLEDATYGELLWKEPAFPC